MISDSTIKICRISWYAPSRIRRRRRAISLVEVVASVALTTVLLIPLMSLLQASNSTWNQFNASSVADSDHRSGIIKSEVAGYIAQLLSRGTEVLYLSSSRDIVYLAYDSNGIETKHRLYQNTADQIFHDSELIAEKAGQLEMRLGDKAKANEGSLVYITITSSKDSSNGVRRAVAWLHRPL